MSDLIEKLDGLAPCTDHRKCHCTYEMMEMSKDIEKLLAALRKSVEALNIYVNLKIEAYDPSEGPGYISIASKARQTLKEINEIMGVKA